MLCYFLCVTAYQLVSPVLFCPRCQRSSLKSQGWCFRVCHATIYIISNASGRTTFIMIKASPIFLPQTLPSLLISHMPPTLQPQVTSHHSLNMPLFQTLCFPICCFFSWSALPSFLYMVNSHSWCKTQLKCHLSSENFLTPAKKNSHSGIH